MIHTDNLARSNSDSSRGIAGRGVATQATRRNLSNIDSTTETGLATIRLTAPTLRQSISRINDADDGSTSSEADISRISQSRGAAAAEGREANVVLIPLDHHPH